MWNLIKKMCEIKKLTRIPSVTASEAGRAQTENLRNCSLETRSYVYARAKSPANGAPWRVRAPFMPGAKTVRLAFNESSCLGLQL